MAFKTKYISISYKIIVITLKYSHTYKIAYLFEENIYHLKNCIKSDNKFMKLHTHVRC